MAWSLATLKSAINEYTQNTYWGATDQQENFVRLAEERINNLVQIDNYNTKTATGDLVVDDSSVTIADSSSAPLSAVYFKIRVGAEVAATAWQFLLLKDYDFLQEYAPKDSVTGTPKYYSFYNDASDLDNATFSFGPIASAVCDYEILYYFKPSSLITASTTTRVCSPDGSTTINFTSGATTSLLVGMSVTGTGVAASTTISSITDSDTVVLSAVVSSGTGVTLTFTESAATTWLGNHAENALLYACLVEAYTFLKGESELLQLYELRFRESVEALVATEGGVFRNKPRIAKPPAVIPQ